MITAAIYGVAVSPAPAERTGEASHLASIASEIAERICEMNEMRANSGTDLVLRLSSVARMDRGAFDIVAAVLHGDTSCLTDSYSERADAVGRKKQTIHYRAARQLEVVSEIFPEVGALLDQIRLSVKHHEDPVSKGQTIRSATE